MRTRLDEIVEEALGRQPRFMPEDCVSAHEYSLLMEQRLAALKICHEVAERAFRHGVEQATPKYAPEQWDIPSIQPAPADPPIGGPYPTDFRWYDGKPAPMTEKCSNCGRVHEPPILCDRRKGERRKCEAWIAHGRYTRWMRYDNETWHTDAQIDRRSGKDRRK